MNKSSLSLLLALGLALLAGCSPSSSGTGSIQFAVAVPQALSASVSRVSVTALAADFPSVSVDLVFANGSWGGTLGDLPAGAHRTFLARAFDASGTALFEGSASGVSIAAGQTALVAITLQQVNAPAFQNEAPIIDSLTASSTSVSVGNSLSLAASASDPNPGDTLSYAWTATAGSFSSATAASTSWTAPASTGIQTLSLTVTDSRGLSSSITVVVNVLPSGEQGQAQLSISFNSTPRVDSLNATASQLAVGQSTAVSASASDLDGDSLTYSWSNSCAGSWANAASRAAQFTPSELPASTCNNCDLTVTVSDGRGGQTTGTVALCVRAPPELNHLPPLILSASGSSGTATARQVLTYEVVASDPEGSALSFSWTATAGSLGTAADSASSSRITWTAPGCVSEGTPLAITATITNAFHLTATKSFSVTGLPVCVPPSWTSTGSLVSPRYGHTATLLPSGKVLVVGGWGSSSTSLATAELYDPATGTWSATGSLHGSRVNHTATLLSNGQVLVAAGTGSGSPGMYGTAEVYDPASGTWRETGLLTLPRVFASATLLLDGQVLLTGGINERSGFLAAAEVLDPSAGIGTWRATGSMASARFFHTTTRLPNGKVLVAAGLDSGVPSTTAEVYDPASGSWSATGSMGSPHSWHAATLLNNGRVLVTGSAYGPPPQVTAEVYDPASNSWSAAASMLTPRAYHSATLLKNGRVLIAGGDGGPLAPAEEYDPTSDTWSAAGSMLTPRSGTTATLLLNGQVLFVGGVSGSDPLSTAELYTPGTP
ncbi:Kelch repeat-containing protein [Hyalangium minutum]|uniref:High-affinity leucine-specific transport system, periplasmic binding protein LivK n=1 Tax=Hyalangium minutum TaxID=394096 RepID=A0A085WC96_9BACT|nr:kelch repeat-containing protein [Hyalangium minutum]KFE65309.1 High-affinity leucine-specific transport system, periplasmic binding protein LivK [Hyalangium minutum]